jgi:RHH-type proline utilization regulon transcriptional repressor/proline dehydrogenase/delta 1-pyrroline-5-carboxylate dehydrogenase
MSPLIAETGGINAMIVDSTALPEQVTRDVMTSAFQSAGQRCSALRLLCVQEDVADRQLEMIAGAMALLQVGDPALLATDVGPIIDENALQRLRDYVNEGRGRYRVIAETPLSGTSASGLYLPPIALELPSVGALDQEVFGPVLHVVRWRGDLDALVDQINALGYGLTLGLHSRSSARAERVMRRARVGNLYVNRNQIGAVVGVQPFGGEGLSGTGPKAGGPRYLERFTVERTVTVDTTAAGGNASLLTIDA